jgi:hypothetical protein
MGELGRERERDEKLEMKIIEKGTNHPSYTHHPIVHT